jgi:histidinol phosphatase-like PHP family hydrolase
MKPPVNRDKLLEIVKIMVFHVYHSGSERFPAEDNLTIPERLLKRGAIPSDMSDEAYQVGFSTTALDEHGPFRAKMSIRLDVVRIDLNKNEPQDTNMTCG